MVRFGSTTGEPMSTPVDYFKVGKIALHDWRIRLMATEESMSFGDAFHLCCLVWCHLYERGGGTMPATEVDAVAEYLGMAKAMLSVGLADDTPEGLRIHGEERAAKFVAYRQRQRDKSIAAHRARYGKEENKELPAGSAGAEASPARITLTLSGSGSSPESGSGESSQHAIARARQAEKRELAKAATEAWVEWFNRTFARSFRVTQELSKQVGAILAQGYSEKPDMRGVALYLRSRWEDDPVMGVNLVPSTILRSTKFAERLDLAKEWGPQFWESP